MRPLGVVVEEFFQLIREERSRQEGIKIRGRSTNGSDRDNSTHDWIIRIVNYVTQSESGTDNARLFPGTMVKVAVLALDAWESHQEGYCQ